LCKKLKFLSFLCKRMKLLKKGVQIVLWENYVYNVFNFFVVITFDLGDTNYFYNKNHDNLRGLNHFTGIIDFMSILQEHRNYRTISTEEFEEQISDLFYILTRELSSAPSDKIYNDYQVINWRLETTTFEYPSISLDKKTTNWFCANELSKP